MFSIMRWSANWSYCPLNIENCLHGKKDLHLAIFVWRTMNALLRLHRCAFTLESPMSTYPISTIITWTGLFFVISLPLWIYMLLIILLVFHFCHNHKNVQFISTQTVLKKGGDICFHLENKFYCLSEWNLAQIWNWITWSQKLGH